MKFLIVDDSRAMQVIVKRGLEQLGYSDNEYKTANNGKDALNIAKDWTPDLILCDWHMPEMTGIQLLQLLNKLELPSNIGFVTSETSESRLKEAKEMGACFIVNKPFTDEDLHKAVLPILQGAIEGEDALKQDTAVTCDKGITLPTAAAFDKAINAVTSSSVKLTEKTTEPLNYEHLPFITGIYAISGTSSIRSICVLDLEASCFLGSALHNLPVEDALDSIQKKAIPKQLLENCGMVLKVISVLFFDQKSGTDLKLENFHLIAKPFDKLDALSRKGGNQRMDFELGIDGYGKGRMSVIAVNR
jgi:CheY-like chemotaxis protein